MNVYEKLQECRAKLHEMEIKESGENKFAGYTYMELGDFLPHIVALCKEYKLCPVICFGEIATMEVINSEKPEEKILFTSPMSTAELKGCHKIQNLGAVESYLRRYLYVNAFDIVEHDALDSTHGKEQPQQRQQAAKPSQQSQGTQQGAPSPSPDAMTEGQRKMIFAKLKAKNVSEDSFKTAFKLAHVADLKKAHVNEALTWIDGAAQSA